ncbi:MAG: ATP-binding cassette domain-containing protein [Spirochaetota bacterium]
MIVLETRGLMKHFGGVVTADHLNFSLQEGELRCLIGPNGAGKTTFFNLISGQLHADNGQILFYDQDITAVPVHTRARLGISRKFQSPTVFDELSVVDNIRVSTRGKSSPFTLFFKRFNPEFEDIAEQLVEKVHLTAKRNWPASKLSHGERQRIISALELSQKKRESPI